MYAGVQHRTQCFHDDGAGAAKAFGQCVGTEKNHGASFRLAEGRAYSTGVRANQVDLELADLFGGNADRSQFAKAGVDAVGSFAGRDELLDHSA